MLLGACAELAVEPARGRIIHGVVVRGGRPVAGAQVLAEGDPIATTDARGAFELRAVRAGPVRVTAFAPDGARSQTLAVEDVVTIAIEPGVIAGVVVDQDGLQVPFVEVFAGNAAAAPTAADGTFRMTGMKPGSYGLSVFDDVHRGTELAPVEAAGVQVRLTAATPQVEGLRLVVRRERLAISGRVVDAAGRPLAGVAVEAGAGGEFRGLKADPAGVSGADGGFVIGDLLRKTYDLRAVAPDGGEAVVSDIAAGRRDVTISVPAGASVAGRLVGFHPGVAVWAFAPDCSVGGGPDGAIMACHAGERTPVGLRFAEIAGPSYLFRGLPPGDYHIEAYAPGERADVFLSLVSGQDLTLDLQSSGSARVSGRVTDFATGAPVPGLTCVVSMLRGDTTAESEPSQYTDEDGTFDFPDVPALPSQVGCYPHGHTGSGGASTRRLRLEPGRREWLELEVTPFSGYPCDLGFDWDGFDVAVSSVVTGSPADRAGVAVGDRVTAVDGRSVERLDGIGLRDLLAARPAGAPVALTIVRGGRSFVLRY
jgi:hypothetical protein